MAAVEGAVAEHTAGSPVDENIVWTNRSPRQIADELQQDGFSVCADTVRRILTENLGLGLRQAEKDEASHEFAFRDEQFQHIARRREWYQSQGWPVLSIDTKKKELLGNFFRPGQAYTNGAPRVLDHDFGTLGVGRMVPYGVYDVAFNEGFLLLAEGNDSSELACDALWRWWRRLGRDHYWRAERVLVLCDCGGSNGNRHYRFKEDLADLAYDLRRSIEHRLFCHVTRAMRGVVLRSIQVARDFIARTTTATGLQVTVEIARKTYAKGRKATTEFMDSMPIRFGNFLPQLNYTALK